MPDMELGRNELDLGRPELATLRHRYSKQPPRPQTSLFSPPTALIVTRRAGEEAPLRDSLEREGWFVKRCDGPSSGGCPVMQGESCELRKSVDAAVVFMDPSELTSGTGAIPRLRCAADSASPGVVALEGSLDGPAYLGQSATVGSLRGPGAVLGAIRALLASRRSD
jgi:hypothetical protein